MFPSARNFRLQLPIAYGYDAPAGERCDFYQRIQLTNNFIIIGIAEFIAASLADFLQDVYDNELGVGMLVYESLELLIQSATKLRHEKRFADFGCAHKQICSSVQQTAHDGSSAVVYIFVKLAHREGAHISR